jgi:hypothetical protein
MIRNSKTYPGHRDCQCYDCLREQGITDPLRRDCLGLLRNPSDGRFSALVTGTQTKKDGQVIDVTLQKRFRVVQ